MLFHACVAAVPETTQGDLLARCRAGDQRAWAELVERYSRYVHAIARRGFRLQPADAEDVFQEVFARTYQRLDAIRGDEALSPWFAQLTRRLCIDKLRASRREALSDLPPEAEIDRTMEQLEEAMALDQAMAELPETCYEVLDRFFRRDQSYIVIGDALGLPSGTIASRISRCLARLRDEYGRNDPAPTS